MCRVCLALMYAVVLAGAVAFARAVALALTLCLCSGSGVTFHLRWFLCDGVFALALAISLALALL